VSVVCINPEDKQRAAELMKFASMRRFSLHDLASIVNGTIPPPGNDPNYMLLLERGWKIVYTFDQLPDPIGWIRHVSISVVADGKTQVVPAPPLVSFVLLELFNLDFGTLRHSEIDDRKVIHLMFPAD